MGMNFYIKSNDKEIHIGKSSLGWQFLFEGNKELNLNSKKEWIDFLFNNEENIYNELNEIIPKNEFLELIEFKSSKNKLLLNHYDETIKVGYKEDVIKDIDGYTILYNEFR